MMYDTPHAHDALQENPAGPGPAELVVAEPERPTTLVVPGTGELVDLAKPADVVRALEAVRSFKAKLDDARRILEEAILDESIRQGKKTLSFGSVGAVISGGPETRYDVEELRKLADLGLPEDRMGELIVETVDYKVDARVAKQLEAANPAYAEVIQRARTVVPKPAYVKVTRP